MEKGKSKVKATIIELVLINYQVYHNNRKKIEISSPNLRLKTEYLNNNSSAKDEAVNVNYSKIETVRAGRIVSNKSSNKTPICSSPQ